MTQRERGAVRRESAVFVALLLALAMPSWWRATNSHGESRRAAKAWEQQQYATAADAYGRAQEVASSPRGAFNLGTAQVAAGDFAEGATTLGEVLEDPTLRADALYNRGNSALAASELDDAVREYIEALKTDPRHTAAKRNLELALMRSENQRRQAEDQQSQSGPQDEEEQQSPADGGQQQPQGEIDLETLLRSVQQQEQEELRRMKGRAADVPVGW
jgi:Ca-activated chloride channel homolog